MPPDSTSPAPSTPIPDISPGPNKISVIFWLLAFPPVGLYLIWKERRLHYWFPNLLIIFGLTNLLSVLTMMFFILPQMSSLYEQLGTKFDPGSLLFSFWGIIIISLLTGAPGFIFKHQIKTSAVLPRLSLFLCIAFLTIQLLAIGWLTQSLIANILTPIYNFTSSPVSPLGL
jgi:hypothetical protein